MGSRSRPSDGRRPERDGFGSILHEVRLFEWLALLSAVAAVAFLVSAPVSTQYARLALWTLRDMAILVGLSMLVIVALAVPRVLRAGPRWREELRGLELAQPRFLGDSLRIVVALSVVQTVHLTLKAYVPIMNHATYDGVLWRLDRWLGLGHPPVVLALRAFGQPPTLHVIDLLYSGLYFLFLWGGVVVFFAGLGRERRLAFFDSFALMWQVGLALYVIVPAWGPVFTRPEIFETALQSCPLTTRVQSVLAAETGAIVRGDYTLAIRFFGLAAFPSLHVAVFALYSLWAGAVARWWRWWNLTLLTVLLIGSLVTGYHYLVDGLAGVALAAGCVLVARRLSARRLATSPRSDAATET